MKLSHCVACVVCLAILALVCSPLVGQDWPQWRGPNRDNKVTGFKLPAAWPAQLKSQWKVPVGLGEASPALVGGNLYTFGREENDEVIRCLDAAAGRGRGSVRGRKST